MVTSMKPVLRNRCRVIGPVVRSCIGLLPRPRCQRAAVRLQLAGLALNSPNLTLASETIDPSGSAASSAQIALAESILPPAVSALAADARYVDASFGNRVTFAAAWYSAAALSNCLSPS